MGPTNPFKGQALGIWDDPSGRPVFYFEKDIMGQFRPSQCLGLQEF